ncbi:unnamed protein product, partial [Discosporangium mesarthrocarpum]
KDLRRESWRRPAAMHYMEFLSQAYFELVCPVLPWWQGAHLYDPVHFRDTYGGNEPPINPTASSDSPNPNPNSMLGTCRASEAPIRLGPDSQSTGLFDFNMEGIGSLQ